MTEQINRIAEIWWNWMWPMFWQVSLLIGFVTLIDFVIRKHVWPQVRYALWLLVLVKLVIPPSFALRTSLVSHVQPMIERSVRKPSVANEPTLYPATGEGMNPDEPLAARLPDAPEPVELAAGPEAVESPNRIDAGIGTAGTVRESLSWRAIGMLVWAATMLLLALRLLLGHRALWHVHCAQKCSRALPPWLPKLAEDTARKLRLRRAPQVVLSSTVNCPAVLGVFRPILLLPEGTVEQVSRQQAQHILLHELAHIKRGDLPVHALCVLLQIFYWFNPLLVLVRRQLQHLRELCCDATVASILRDRTEDYYQMILQTVERLLEKPRWCGIGLLGLIEDPSRLRVRLAWLRKKPSRYPGLRRATASALVVTMLTFILPMAKAEKSVEGNTVLTGEVDEKTTKSLHEAVNDGDIEQVRLHLSSDTDIESKGRNGRTALHIAAIKGYAEIARLLISKGADINAKDTWNRHPLHYASMKGHKDVAEGLIAKGAIVNAPRNWLGWTAIHTAARNGHREVVELLLANAADVNGESRWILSPAELAMEGNHTEIVELLISKGADISPLHVALYMKDRAKAKSLIEGGADVNKQTPSGVTPLHMAIRAGLKDISKILVDKGAGINAKDIHGRAPLHEAAERGYKDIVEMLLASGADVNAGAQYNRTAAEMAMGEGHTEIVELLISKGADISPLHFAIYIKDEGKARSLIEGGADVNKPTPYGTTPLDSAIRRGLEDIARLLIDKGADVNAKDNWNWTPLHTATGHGLTDIAELLIAKGANVNAFDGDSADPLWYAQKEGHNNIVELLVANGADPNTRPNWTSLHTAAEKGNANTAELLIAEGVNVNAKSGRGQTALHIAARQGHKKIVELLIEHDANVNAGAVYNRTAAEMAMGGGHTEIVELLISKGADISPLHFAIYVKDEGKARSLIEGGADVNKPTPYGTTPLDSAIRRGLEDIARLLIDKGAGVNAKDNWNWTPLHTATGHGLTDIAELLIAKGANVNACDCGGRTPLSYAEKEGHTNIAELLRKHGTTE